MNWANAHYRIDACNSNGCTASLPIGIRDAMLAAIGYLKSPTGFSFLEFGQKVALSADGNTLAVSVNDHTAATGAGGNRVSDCGAGTPVNCAPHSGAIFVYARNLATGDWEFQEYLKASNTGANDRFGGAIALSRDGNTLAVGTPYEDGPAAGDQTSNAAPNSGAVYVFARSGSTWTQQAYLKASNAEGGDINDQNSGDQFGESISLSADGNTLAVGAAREDSAATTVGGDETSNAVTNAGAVYVFTRSGSVWTQQAYIKSSNNGVGYQNSGDLFGHALALSGDGNTLAVGADGEDSAITVTFYDSSDPNYPYRVSGITTNPNDNSASNSGAVYVFRRNGAVWSQETLLKATNAEAGDGFGSALSISYDGNLLAVGTGRSNDTDGEKSSTVGVYDYTETDSSINGHLHPVEQSSPLGSAPEVDDNAPGSGAVYVYQRTVTSWKQHAYIKSSNTGVGDRFGYALALSGDGNSLAVGAFGEDSNATGIEGDQSNNIMDRAGAVYIYRRNPNPTPYAVRTNWIYSAYVKASNTGVQHYFGVSVSLSQDGQTLAVGASLEDSAATGFGGNQAADCNEASPANCAPSAGAVYLY
jgi:hypothetical protein